MRNITFRNIDNELFTLKIHSSASGDGILESDSIQITHDKVGYFTDIVGSSRLEFTLIAETDGQYRDLYTTSATGIKVELLKGAEVIFSGYLDSEIYEEDYNTKKNYPIDFKAGNIKILKRIDFDLNGKHSVKTILQHCLNKLGMTLNYSSSLKSGSINSGDFITNTSVFYKDGEYTSCFDVIESVLQSLALRSMVIGNTFHVFDNETITGRTPLKMEDYLLGNATLKSAECYKEVVLTLDTASDKQVFNLEVDKFEFPFPAASERSIKEKQGDGDADVGFVQMTTNKKEFENVTVVNAGCVMARNKPRFSGSDQIYIKSNTITRENTSVVMWKSRMLPITMINSSDWFLNLKLDVLLSIRSNPFRGVNESDDTNPKTSWYNNHENDFRNQTNYTQVFGDVLLYNDAGVVTHHLSNIGSSRDATPAVWVSGAPGTKGQFRFDYYDNMKNEHGFNSGWQTNSPTVPALGVGYSYGALTKSMKNKGTLAMLPPVSGHIEVQVYQGVKCIDGADGGTIRQNYSDFKHLWYKDLKVSICDANGHDNYSESEYEYRATLDNEADSTLNIDNKLGAIRDEDYSCRAGYVGSNGKFLTSYQAGSLSDILEVVNLNRINQTYTGQRNCFECKVKPLSIVGSILSLEGVNKSFWVNGFEYYPEDNYFQIQLNERV